MSNAMPCSSPTWTGSPHSGNLSRRTRRSLDHSLWKDLPPKSLERGHGGTDIIELAEFVRAVRAKTQTPIDVYDSVVMSVVFPLSQQSIAAGSAPVKCPDFTGGKWETTKAKFAVDG